MDITQIINNLSYTELQAVKETFKKSPNTPDGYILVLSKIADSIGVSRSVFVNAMRKLEMCGIVKTQSLGVKGTYIEVLNPEFLTALKSAK